MQTQEKTLNEFIFMDWKIRNFKDTNLRRFANKSQNFLI